MSKKCVSLQRVTMYIHSSPSREFTLFVKGFINFGFWFWEPSPLKRWFLFLFPFVEMHVDNVFVHLFRHEIAHIFAFADGVSDECG